MILLPAGLVVAGAQGNGRDLTPRLTRQIIQEIFPALDKAGLRPGEPLGPPDELFTDIFTAIVSPREIGQNIFGSRYFPFHPI